MNKMLFFAAEDFPRMDATLSSEMRIFRPLSVFSFTTLGLVPFCLFAFCFGTAGFITLSAQTNPDAFRKPENRTEEDSLEERVAKLIKKLGSEKYSERVKAEKELKSLATAASSLLAKAAEESDDFEIVSRLKLILKSIPKATHILVDSLGKPIKGASLEVHLESIEFNPEAADTAKPFDGDEAQEGPKPLLRTFARTSDPGGGFNIPVVRTGSVRIVVSHQDYGRAEWNGRIPFKNTQVQVPLVSVKSEAYRRAIKGVVTNAEGKPIKGAEVVCNSIRTPGDGLISPTHPSQKALTDAQGKFALYPMIPEAKDRGQLIPKNSRFQIQASLRKTKTVVPVGGVYANIESAKLKLETDSIIHRIAFESDDGKQPDQNALRSRYRIYRESTVNQKRVTVPVDAVAAVKGVRLPHGTYHAERSQNGRTIHFQPIEVNENSTEILQFKLPPKETYYGRLVDGVTGKPIKGGFVIGYSASGKGTLADLTDDEWKKLQELGMNPDWQDPAIKPVNAIHRTDAMTRSDKDGYFQLEQPIERPFYGLIAFAKDRVPFLYRGFYLKDKKSGEIHEPVFKLFPAAKVKLQPVIEEKSINLWPKWQFADQGQPDWFERMQQATAGKPKGEFQYRRWLRSNQMQTVYVPVGVRLQLRLRPSHSSPDHAPNRTRFFTMTKTGETLDLGKINFPKSVPTDVKVVDKKGKPVEGIPVRWYEFEEGAWSLPHNTDKHGMVRLMLFPDSQGKVRAGEGFGPKGKLKTAEVKFQVKKESPKEALQIVVDQEIVQNNLGR